MGPEMSKTGPSPLTTQEGRPFEMDHDNVGSILAHGEHHMRTQTPTWWRLLGPGEWRGVGERGRSGQEGPPAMTWLEKIEQEEKKE